MQRNVDVNLILVNDDGENPCSFRAQMIPVLDLRDGDWFIALSSIDINFVFTREVENVFVLTSIAESTHFGSRKESVLRNLGTSTSMSFCDEELMFIKAKQGLHNYVHVSLTDEEGRVLESRTVHPQTLLALRLFHIPRTNTDAVSHIQEDTFHPSNIAHL